MLGTRYCALSSDQNTPGEFYSLEGTVLRAVHALKTNQSKATKENRVK